MSGLDAVTNLRRASMALFLEVPESIGRDVHAKVEAVIAQLDAATLQEQALRTERDEAMRLLNPTCSDETLSGAIRNLQQAHLSERGNAETAEQREQALREALEQMVELVEAWQGGIFKRSGITWTEDPPAVRTARALLAAAGVPQGEPR